MGGGLIQLVAYGAQDIYLTGQPQITFWKSVYRRHTNFAIESIQQTINGTAIFDNIISVTVSRKGDLLKKLWIEYSPYDLLGGINQQDPGYIVGSNVGHSLLDTIEIDIGGQLIDRHYGKWLTIWNYLTEENSNGIQGAINSSCLGPGEMDTPALPDLSRPTKYNRMAYTHRSNITVINNNSAPRRAYIPLQFWFCKNPGLALPLIALQYHEVVLKIKISTYSGITNNPVLTGNEFNNFTIYGDYVYLDTTERRQFAQNAHEYLIDQLQYENFSTNDQNLKLSFNHPVKELIWAIPPNKIISSQSTAGSSSPSGSFININTAYGVGGNNNANNYVLLMNSNERFSPRDITYFTRNQVWDYHTGFGSILYPDSIAVYSFALRPEEHQPSGTCNFSRLDTVRLIRSVGQPVDIYAVNYNVLRIMSGMGGLAYSN
jgi:hypothetical protein